MRTDAEGNQIQTTEGGFFSNFADPHRKIEHWGIRVGVVLVLMSATVGYSEVHHHNEVVKQEMTVNPSGTRVDFSQAKSTFTLNRAVLSKDGKWAFIPFKLSDMTYLPNNPAKYKVLIQAKGGKHASLAYKPVIRLVLFGSSGKGAIAVYSSTGIQNEPINIFLLNMQPLAKVDQDSDTIAGDTSGGSQTDSGMQALRKKYDMVMFSANPGAKNVQKAARTTASLDDKETLYMSLFGGRSTENIKAIIKHQNTRIKHEKLMADEDRSKLAQMGFKVPKDPAWMQDGWKPFDAVDVKTGKTRNGKNAVDYLSSNGDSNIARDKDNVDYPSTLTGNTDIKMDNDGDSQGRQASALWQDLTARWDAVHSAKRNIWVKQQTNLYKVYQQRRRQKEETTIGPSSTNTYISRVHIRTVKEK